MNKDEKIFRVAYIDNNDYVNGCDEGLCISIWFQGCPHRCPGCHNSHTWNFEDGIEMTNEELLESIFTHIKDNGILRNISILGGEPLRKENINATLYIINNFYEKYHDLSKIFLWTGYTMEEIKNTMPKDVLKTLTKVDLLITDRFEVNKMDHSLRFRGSSNQRVWKSKKGFFGRKLINITKTITNID